MKDLQNSLVGIGILDPVDISATAVHTDIDLQGFNSVVLCIYAGLDAGSGLSSSHKLVFTLADSPDGSTYTAVTSDDMIGVTVTGGIILTIDAVGEDNTLYQFGYVGGDRYLQLTYTETGTVSMPMAVWIEKSDGQDKPVIS